MGFILRHQTNNMNKRILLAGTRPNSIGRYIGKALYDQGWDVWLYSRHAEKIENERWHERACDITSEDEIKRLLDEIPDLEVVMFLADTGGHGALETLSESQVKGIIGSKLTGSALLCKALFADQTKGKNIKLIWCAGKLANKSNDLMAYAMVNAGLASFVDAVNEHNRGRFEAYYLPTPLISPSTLGDAFIKEKGATAKAASESPKTILDKVQNILQGRVPVGMVNPDEMEKRSMF